ncbi:hypothetical protein L7F22_029248 [Adiantum nelumboides]|nr:hypothetical protein [Adiantum nelumboides]
MRVCHLAQFSALDRREGAAAQPIPILPPPSLPDSPASPVITPLTSHPVPPIQPPDVSPDHALSDSDSDLDVADATPEVDLAPPRREKRIPGWLYSTVASSGVTELLVPPPAGLPRRSAHLQKRGQVYESNEFVNFALMSQIQDTPVEPSSVQEALQHNCWKRAMHAELDAIERNKTWTLVPKPPKRKVVSTKWIFKTKYKADGSLDKHKARLVARGFSQRPGVDFDETYAPTARMTTIRTVLCLAAHFGWAVFQMDVKSAFLNGEMEKEVYVSQPPGFRVTGKEDHVYRLWKALYGLKQAGRQWYLTLDQFLVEGFIWTKAGWPPVRMMDVLVNKGLAVPLKDRKEGVYNDDQWEELDARARAMICLHLGKSIFFTIMDKATAFELWDSLCSAWDGKSAFNKFLLMKKLMRLSMKEGSSVSSHLNEFNALYLQLTSKGLNFDDEMKAIFLLCSLPTSWDTFNTTISNSTHGDKLAFGDVTSALLIEEI